MSDMSDISSITFYVNIQICAHHILKRECKVCDKIGYISKLFRCRLRGASRSRGATKSWRSHAVAGCSWAEFVAHIERKMAKWNATCEPGREMTWENTQRDHIKPIALAQDEAELLALHHYTNYQPLLCADNLRKSTRWGERDEAHWRAEIFHRPEYTEIYFPVSML